MRVIISIILVIAALVGFFGAGMNEANGWSNTTFNDWHFFGNY